MKWSSTPDSLFWLRLARVKRGWRATLLGPPLGRLTIQAGSLLAVFLAGVWMERGFGQGRDSWLPCTSVTATSPSEQDAPPLDDGVGTASPTTQSLATLRLEMSATRERIEALKEERKENQVVMHLMALEDELASSWEPERFRLRSAEIDRAIETLEEAYEQQLRAHSMFETYLDLQDIKRIGTPEISVSIGEWTDVFGEEALAELAPLLRNQIQWDESP